MSLHVKYRSKTFATFYGNRDVVEGVKTVLNRTNPPSAFMFVGPGGTGKTTLGRLVRHSLGCSDVDFTELNSADDRGIKGVRKLIEGLKFAPLRGKVKVVLLDEAHMLTKEAQEALLKVLEEPPEYVHFCICTTNPEALKPTFKRRCHYYELQLLKNATIVKLLTSVIKREKVKPAPSAVLNKIADIADGSAGQALKLLDMVIDMTDVGRALNTLKATGAADIEIIQIAKVLCNRNNNTKTKWLHIKKILKVYRGDGESARRPILGYLSKVLLSTGDEHIGFMMEHFERNFFDSGNAGLILACYKAAMEE